MNDNILFFQLNLSHTKSEIVNAAETEIVKTLEVGESPLHLLMFAAQIKVYAEIIEKNEELRLAAIREAEKYPKNDRVIHGHKFDIREVGTSYDYSQSEAYLFIKGKEAEIIDVRKSIENMAKAIKEPAYIEVEGNHLAVQPAQKTSTTKTVITLK